VNSPLDESYFQWLYGQVADPKETRPGLTYWNLLRELYKTEFSWTVHHDDNRVEDGKELRAEFSQEKGLYDYGLLDPGWMSLGCSMLELLIGLSRRLAFDGGFEPADWFWRMLENIGLHLQTDSPKFPREDISEILDRIIWRKYEYNGHGGLFPLRDPMADQREKELWYQMQAYLIENC
jgi:hypothetical protein